MICTHCGADNKDDALKCAQCGEPLQPSADKNTKKKSNAASPDPQDFGGQCRVRTGRRKAEKRKR